MLRVPIICGVCYVLLLAAVALSICRFRGCRNASYQAVAHLYTGGLIGAWLVSWHAHYAWLWIGLTIVEGTAFLWFRRKIRTAEF
jgi:hypothetical protein